MGRFHDVVSKHRADSQAVLVAATETCVTIAYDEEENVTGRSFRVVEPDALAGLDLAPSWVMAVLLCPGDTAKPVADWAVANERDARRVLFYLHPDTEPRPALSPWEEAGLQIHSVWTVENWKQLHKPFGQHWNVQIFDDFR